MSESKYRSLDADRAIQSSDDDRFGFEEIAKRLSQSVVSAAAQPGMVIAVEGKWGSGKSSLVNLLEQEIESDDNNNTSIVLFSPWLVGDEDNLVVTLLSAIATACEKTGIDISPPNTRLAKLWRRISKAKSDATKIAEDLRSFSVAASQKLSPILSLASVVEPSAAIASGILKKGTDVLETLAPDKTLDSRKSTLSQQLSNLPHRFVVVVDDIDRLEPEQAIEVIRLVRSVADFPNIIYILCYDKAILTEAIKTSLRVSDGAAYLQKIIQVSFSIPRPEPFDLRRWLWDELTDLYILETGEQPDPSTLDD